MTAASIFERIGALRQEDLVERTRRTAARLFSGPTPVQLPYTLWKEFDPELAKDLSLFITGQLYARDVLPLDERQLIAVSALAALQKIDELKVHIHGALNVGVPVRKLAEAIFQIGVYAGFPAVNAALAALKELLIGRGEWPPSGEPSESKLTATDPESAKLAQPRGDD